MKRKLSTVLFTLVLFLSVLILLPTDKAEAATCNDVTLHLNKTTFTSSDTTMDVYATKASSCGGTLNYEIEMVYTKPTTIYRSIHKGSFAYQTPTQNVNLNGVDRSVDREAQVRIYVEGQVADVKTVTIKAR